MPYFLMTTNGDAIEHSASGREWKKHKYIKKIGNTYYYDERAYERDRKRLEKEGKYVDAELQYAKSGSARFEKRSFGEMTQKDTIQKFEKQRKNVNDQISRNREDLQNAKQYIKTANGSSDDYNTFSEALIKKDISGEKHKRELQKESEKRKKDAQKAYIERQKEAKKKEREKRIEEEKERRQELREKAWSNLLKKRSV